MGKNQDMDDYTMSYHDDFFNESGNNRVDMNMNSSGGRNSSKSLLNEDGIPNNKSLFSQSYKNKQFLEADNNKNKKQKGPNAIMKRDNKPIQNRTRSSRSKSKPSSTAEMEEDSDDYSPMAVRK